MKYIDADKLIAEIERRIESWTIRGKHSPAGQGRDTCDSRVTELSDLLSFVTSLQQDEKIIELEMCSQAYWEERGWMMIPPNVTLKGIESLLEQIRKKLQQEQQEVDLEKFTEKIKTFQGRYKHPEIVSIKGAMAFMARMFYQYPNVARRWYDSLPKATMD